MTTPPTGRQWWPPSAASAYGVDEPVPFILSDEPQGEPLPVALEGVEVFCPSCPTSLVSSPTGAWFRIKHNGDGSHTVVHGGAPGGRPLHEPFDRDAKHTVLADDAHAILSTVADRMDEHTYSEVSTLVEGVLDRLQVADAEQAELRAENERLREDKSTLERWRDQWILTTEEQVTALARAEDRAEAAEAKVARVRALPGMWRHTLDALLAQHRTPGTRNVRAFVENATEDIAAALTGSAEPEATDGCDCTELCAMGPTCPGGMLARLPGSGCWRTEPEVTEPSIFERLLADRRQDFGPVTVRLCEPDGTVRSGLFHHGTDYACTGSAHHKGARLLCDNPIHRAATTDGGA